MAHLCHRGSDGRNDSRHRGDIPSWVSSRLDIKYDGPSGRRRTVAFIVRENLVSRCYAHAMGRVGAIRGSRSRVSVQGPSSGRDTEVAVAFSHQQPPYPCLTFRWPSTLGVLAQLIDDMLSQKLTYMSKCQ
ncbi:hypothetical protein HAX54_016248 [Datura stramonium]|uniref:Uncharacterized protein n=1 Tax=Datura stramonium TaxID=4076 RepID=A0ABS8UIK0_DATST|nr:hypothetical protein [Datura stramonium]